VTPAILDYVFTFQSRLLTAFLIGGLGIEDRQNGVFEVSVFLCVIPLCGIEPEIKFTTQSENINGLEQ
jgi:hypothetical protein